MTDETRRKAIATCEELAALLRKLPEGAWVAERIGLLGVREQARALLAASTDATTAE